MSMRSVTIKSAGDCLKMALMMAGVFMGGLNDRKLLLNKRELKKLQLKLKDKGYTVIPLKVFFSDKGFVKVEIGLARGKKLHDKRETIKNRDLDKEMKRFLG